MIAVEEQNSLETQVAQDTQQVGIGYDIAGRRTSLTYPNGASTDYFYDTASRLTQILHQGPSGTIEDLQYTYDAAGNRISFDRTGPQADLPAPVQAAYDAANQQVEFNPINPGTPNLTYDANGNLTSQTDASGTTTYTWDARNRLIAINGPSMTASFEYDALGRRISKTINGTTTEYQFDGYDIVAEISGSAVATTYLRSLNLDEPFTRQTSSGTDFYHTDALGSVLALTDQTGAVQASYRYDPFGNTTISGTSSNAFTYTGRESDAGTGLLFYRARYYSPQLHRFISEDPLRLGAGDINFYAYVDSVGKPETNLYQYSGNNPVNYIDPLGLFNILAGGGFSTVAIQGAEASAGIIINPGLFGQEADIGTFGSIGPGLGVNVSADFFIGFVKGGKENVSGETANINIVGGPVSITLFTDPKTGRVTGGTIGYGPSVFPVGASGSYSITRTQTLRDLLNGVFGPGGQALCGRKS